MDFPPVSSKVSTSFHVRTYKIATWSRKKRIGSSSGSTKKQKDIYVAKIYMARLIILWNHKSVPEM